MAGLLAVAGIACGRPGPPEPLTPQTLAPAPVNPETTATAANPEVQPTPVPRTPPPTTETEADDSGGTPLPDVTLEDDPSVTIIGTSEPTQPEVQRNLVEAALEERARRRDAAPARVVITDKNLAAMGAGASVTESNDPPVEAEPVAVGGSPTASLDEQQWRSRARQLRESWANAEREVTSLRAEAERLRTRFYAEDDPFVRDGQIKPAWDRVLDRLAAAEAQAAAGRGELDAFLEEGRQAGALPGWLREGSELEPEPPVERPDDSPAPSEPPIAPEHG